MVTIRTVLLAAVAFVGVGLSRAQSSPDLDIYFIDVEGGQATLFVTPDHRSLLVDTGWDGHDARDAKRIVAVAKAAGLSRLDYVVITHYHDDHVGGAPQLAALIPVGTFVDHGLLYEHCPACVARYDDYIHLLAQGKSKRLTVKPGDTLPFRAMSVRVVSSNGEVIAKPLPGAGKPNDICATSELRPQDTTENSHSVGLLLQFGQFRAVDLGDLTWDMERKLMCPANLIGDVSLLVVSHHGWKESSSPAYVGGVHAEAAIMDNGATKGGSLPVLETFQQFAKTDLWQLHRSKEGGDANTAADRIANLTGDASDEAFYIKVSAHRDGSFTVFNQRNGYKADYAAR